MFLKYDILIFENYFTAKQTTIIYSTKQHPNQFETKEDSSRYMFLCSSNIVLCKTTFCKYFIALCQTYILPPRRRPCNVENLLPSQGVSGKESTSLFLVLRIFKRHCSSQRTKSFPKGLGFPLLTVLDP